MTRISFVVGALAVLSAATSTTVAVAQDAPPSYKADPDVYKTIFEDQNFRVIDSIRKKGVHDKLHSHPLPSAIYFLTDCKTQLYGADGKPVGSPRADKAGMAQAAPVVKAHSAENVGDADCHTIFVERK